jgi:histone deacetylase complex subunit SAP18
MCFHTIQSIPDTNIRRDATLRELVTSLRALPPNPYTTTLRHPIARFSFRVIFADPTAQGRIASRDVGSVNARDLTQLTLLDSDFDMDGTAAADEEKIKERERKLADERTLEELRIMPGDWLDVAVILPSKPANLPQPSSTLSGPGQTNIRGAALNGERSGRDSMWGHGAGTSGPAPRGRWTKDSDPLSTQNWRGGAPRGGPGRASAGDSGANYDRERGGRGGFGGDRGRGGGVVLNRRGIPRRPSPDRTLGGASERPRPPRRNRSRSASFSRSRSPRLRSPRSRSPMRSRSRSPRQRH